MLSPLAILLAPAGRLVCNEPYLTEESPDERWTLTVCGRPMFFAMPGSGSDAPGWIVLRDETQTIRGVSDISMLQIYGAMSGVETVWTPRRVSRLMVFDLPLDPGGDGFDRWWDERIWRWRALLGLTPSDENLG